MDIHTLITQLYKFDATHCIYSCRSIQVYMHLLLLYHTRYIYAYIHIYTYICIYTYIYIHIYTYIYTCIYIHTYIYIYTHIYIYIHIYIYNTYYPFVTIFYMHMLVILSNQNISLHATTYHCMQQHVRIPHTLP